MSKVIHQELELSGRKLVLETGELAPHANASVLASYGETVVLATAVAKEAAPDVDFFPLSVDYEEKLYAGGKISTSRFIKREGRPSEEAVLTSRLIDRAVRPLFPKDYQAEVQVIITVLSVDGENDPDVISLIAAAAALQISDIPWNGPLSAVRVGRQNGGYLINPTEEDKKFSSLDLVLASHDDEIVMIEANGQETEEAAIAGAVKEGLAANRQIIEFVKEFAKGAARPKQTYTPGHLEPSLEKTIRNFIEDKLMKDFDKKSQDETWFSDSLKFMEEELITAQQLETTTKMLSTLLEDMVADRLRTDILTHQKRPDGRAPDDLREITTRVSLLPRTHGTGLFQRGETQVLSIATLASPALEQLIEGMSKEGTKRYIHHYNFPPFSTGEVKRLGSPGRREIGHGALAERALLPVIPPLEAFPYTIRIVSEVLSSAGSTSMASASGSTLALMDAGVPIKEPVAGISIGLVTDKKDKNKYVLLTDIAYQEDAQGDMDFKVAGTKNGITVIQMDTKLTGVSEKIVEEVLGKARVARLAILEKILAAIPFSRKTISRHAPTVILVKIDPAKIGEVIGSGGRTINRIIAQTGAQVDVDEEGTVSITSKDPQGAQKAAAWIEGIVKEPQPGETYEGPVKRILPFGAMVEILPGKEGLVHISRLADHRVDKVEDVVKIGQIVKVHVAEIDDQGRLNLSMNSSPITPGGQSSYQRRPTHRPRPRR